MGCKHHVNIGLGSIKGGGLLNARVDLITTIYSVRGRETTSMTQEFAPLNGAAILLSFA